MNKLILIIMVNLLYNCTTKPDQNSDAMKNKSNVIEVVLFEANSQYSKKEVETALTSLNDIIKLHSGFIERITAMNEEGKYIDIIYWTDIKSAKDAALATQQNNEAQAIFDVIKPKSIQMHHFTAFNQFEE